MLRVIALGLALFALPFALYAAYALLWREGRPRDVFAAAPLAYLLACGLALVAAGFVVVGVLGGAGPEGTYEPAVLRDGEIVPGRIIAPGGQGG
jgi:hypothetical protein